MSGQTDVGRGGRLWPQLLTAGSGRQGRHAAGFVRAAGQTGPVTVRGHVTRGQRSQDQGSRVRMYKTGRYLLVSERWRTGAEQCADEGLRPGADEGLRPSSGNASRAGTADQNSTEHYKRYSHLSVERVKYLPILRMYSTLWHSGSYVKTGAT